VSLDETGAELGPGATGAVVSLETGTGAGTTVSEEDSTGVEELRVEDALAEDDASAGLVVTGAREDTESDGAETDAGGPRLIIVVPDIEELSVGAIEVVRTSEVVTVEREVTVVDVVETSDSVTEDKDDTVASEVVSDGNVVVRVTVTTEAPVEEETSELVTGGRGRVSVKVISELLSELLSTSDEGGAGTIIVVGTPY
jgi:hypothetical protein